MYFFCVNNCVINARSGSAITVIISFGSWYAVKTSCSTFAMAKLLFKASFPPLKITALPDLIHKPAASAVTFGRASKIIQITPNGIRILLILRPLGITSWSLIVPTTSGNFATVSKPTAISSIR